MSGRDWFLVILCFESGLKGCSVLACLTLRKAKPNAVLVP